MKNTSLKIILAGAIILTAGVGTYTGLSPLTKHGAPTAKKDFSIAAQTEPIILATSTQTASAEPLANARQRVTKKPFGIKVSPKNSPVKPERFTGIHTGIDLEILPGEEDAEAPVKALCSGKLLIKEIGSGYGGVMAQSCFLDNQNVTVVYGHLRLSSIAKKEGDVIRAGEQIGVLGQGFTAETDKERKHLHLGVHIGRGLDLRGYVDTSAELANWLDPLKFLP